MNEVNKKIIIFLTIFGIFTVIIIAIFFYYSQSNKVRVNNMLKTAESNNQATATLVKESKGWGLVSLKSDHQEVDETMTVLKLKNNNWEVQFGPGTDFDIDELSKAGAPPEIISIIRGE